MEFRIEQLPAVNAALNATAAILLLVGWLLIKRGRELAHRNAMLAAFGTSTVFLVCYLTYHNRVGHVPFSGPAGVKAVYLTILLTHIVLAALVPFLAMANIYLGFANRRRAHRRLARWTFPIWMYVSITGVVIYVMLYQVYPVPRSADIIDGAGSTLEMPAP